MKRIIFTVIALTMLSFGLQAEEAEKQTMFNGSTNLQLFYDFGKDRKFVTSTIEGFYNDPWGNSFFFIDTDYQTKHTDQGNKFISGTYWEIARCLNFWQGSKLGFLSLHVEYNGGVYRAYPINHAFLVGVDFFAHSKDFKNTFNFKILHKRIAGQKDLGGNPFPMQFTFVWGCQDIFGVPGLRFSGFADFWGERHTLYTDRDGHSILEESKTVFISEPQLWYAVGQHFGCPNLNIGSEIEFSVNFGSTKGFMCRPCAGIKWVF